MCEAAKGAGHKLICIMQDERGAEFQNATITLLIGLWWGSPFWTVSESCPGIYQFMDWLHPIGWATLFISVALLQHWALWKNDLWWRKNLMLAKGTLWTNLAITTAYKDHTVLAFPIFALLAINAFRGYLCTRPKKAH